MKGKVCRWKDDKGFGFIQPEDGSEQVFFHVSNVKTNARRPRLGDSVVYEPMRDPQNRLKARGVVIEGVDIWTKPSGRTPVDQKPRPKRREGPNYLLPTLIFAVVAVLAWIGYNEYPFRGNIVPATQPAIRHAPQYQCDGRTHCSQMTSCSEATFFVQHCPGTKMDGDGDGVPCESQWCEN